MLTAPVVYHNMAVMPLMRWQELCYFFRDICWWLSCKGHLTPGWFCILFCFVLFFWLTGTGEEARTTLSFCYNLQCSLRHSFRQNDCTVSGSYFMSSSAILCLLQNASSLCETELIIMAISQATKILGF